MCKSRPLLFLILLISTPTILAQQDLIAPVVGTVTGLVEDSNGDMVAPQAAVSATVVATDTNGSITADISGTASCTGGLGLHVTFEAQFDAASNTFSGMYSDVPGAAPNLPLTFTNNGGLSWTASLEGTAPSSSGTRAYDLSFDFEVPETAVFAGGMIPEERTYAGNLATTKSVQVPVSVPEVGIDANLDFDVVFSGQWDAVAVPQIDGSALFTGSATGSFASSNTQSLTVNVPGGDPQTIEISINGSFGGSLFLVDADTVSFKGSWVATGGGQSYGGDIDIDIEFADTSSFPFTVSGAIPVATGFSQLPQIEIPFSVSGEFPLDLQ